LQAYSYENDAQKNIFHTRDNSTFVAFDDFRERVTYLLVGTSPTDAKCQTRPSFGELFVPPVASFRFRAIETCTWCPTPIQIQTWEGRTRTQGDFFYHTTNDAVQAPVGFFDLDRKVRARGRGGGGGAALLVLPGVQGCLTARSCLLRLPPTCLPFPPQSPRLLLITPPQIANVFLEFEAIKGGQWPARVWEKPVECQ